MARIRRVWLGLTLYKLTERLIFSIIFNEEILLKSLPKFIILSLLHMRKLHNKKSTIRNRVHLLRLYFADITTDTRLSVYRFAR